MTYKLALFWFRREIAEIKSQLQEKGADLVVQFGKPLDVLKKLKSEISFEAIYTNHDYEPYATQRDGDIRKWCNRLWN